MKFPLAPLPPLAFGNESALSDTCPEKMGERITAAMGWPAAYYPLDREQAFHHKSALATINGLKVVATASTAMDASIGDAGQPSVLIARSGHCVSRFDRRGIPWDAAETAIFIPKMARGGRATTRSALLVDLDGERIEAIAKSMLWQELSDRRIIDLHNPQQLKLRVGGFHFDRIFSHFGQLIDLYAKTPGLLEKCGLEDCFYRAIVMMMRPDLFIGEETMRAKSANYDAASTDRVCDQIRINLDKKISLSDLESWSGLSSRMLQYAFQKRFACTPMQWVQQQRLELIRTRLLNARRGDRVSAIALEYQVSNLGTFAQIYAKRYGELPSTTLKQALLRANRYPDL